MTLTLAHWRAAALTIGAAALLLIVVAVGRMNAADTAAQKAAADLALVRAHQTAAAHVVKALRFANAEERRRVDEAWARLNALRARRDAIPERTLTPVVVDAIGDDQLRYTLEIVKTERDSLAVDNSRLRAVADEALAEVNRANIEAMQRMVRDSVRLVELAGSLDSVGVIAARAEKRLKPSRLARVGRAVKEGGKAVFWYLVGRKSATVLP